MGKAYFGFCACSDGNRRYLGLSSKAWVPRLEMKRKGAEAHTSQVEAVSFVPTSTVCEAFLSKKSNQARQGGPSLRSVRCSRR